MIRINSETVTPYIRPEHETKNPDRMWFQFWKPKLVTIPETWMMKYAGSYTITLLDDVELPTKPTWAE